MVAWFCSIFGGIMLIFFFLTAFFEKKMIMKQLLGIQYFLITCLLLRYTISGYGELSINSLELGHTKISSIDCYLTLKPHVKGELFFLYYSVS